MRKIIPLCIYILVVISSFGQAKQGSDKLFYDENGKLFTGISKELFPDSTLHAEYEIKQGELDGLTKIYSENGQLEEIRSFKEGKMHGKWEKWNRQQVKIAEANYNNNLKEGKWFVWDDNGTLRYDMTYSKGNKTGTWQMYDEKGNLTDQKNY